MHSLGLLAQRALVPHDCLHRRLELLDCWVVGVVVHEPLQSGVQALVQSHGVGGVTAHEHRVGHRVVAGVALSDELHTGHVVCIGQCLANLAGQHALVARAIEPDVLKHAEETLEHWALATGILLALSSLNQRRCLVCGLTRSASCTLTCVERVERIAEALSFGSRPRLRDHGVEPLEHSDLLWVGDGVDLALCRGFDRGHQCVHVFCVATNGSAQLVQSVANGFAQVDCALCAAFDGLLRGLATLDDLLAAHQVSTSIEVRLVRTAEVHQRGDDGAVFGRQAFATGFKVSDRRGDAGQLCRGQRHFARGAHALGAFDSRFEGVAFRDLGVLALDELLQIAGSCLVRKTRHGRSRSG